MNAFTWGFLTGCIVTVTIFLVVFGLVYWLRRWKSKPLTMVSDSYARVDEQDGKSIELGGVSSQSSSSSGGGTFVIGGEDEREELTHLELNVDPQLSPQEFESNWLSFSVRENLNFSLTFGDANIEEILSSQRIKCMASGQVGARQKYYFFAREKHSGAVFLMEVFFLSRERELAAEIRCANAAMLPDIVAYLRQALRPFSRPA